MFCQKCGRNLDDEAIMCPSCGTMTANAGRPAGKKAHPRPLTEEEIEAEKARKKRKTRIITFSVIGFIVFNWIVKLIEYLL